MNNFCNLTNKMLDLNMGGGLFFLVSLGERGEKSGLIIVPIRLEQKP